MKEAVKQLSGGCSGRPLLNARSGAPPVISKSTVRAKLVIFAAEKWPTYPVA